MNNKSTKTIDITQKTATIISSRYIVNNDLKMAINKIKTRNINLDFKNVEFISRSAAHALIILKEDLLRQSPKKELHFINMPDEVEKMIKIVAASKAVPSKDIEFNPKSVSIATL
ncbi:MAG: STAS domain-containing protein [Patescibacteria group bacterium]